MGNYNVVADATTSKEPVASFDKFTIGEVMDTNDPHQMGRLRVYCPGLGDHEEMEIEDMPWAFYVSPFGGIHNLGMRGTEEVPVEGPTSYGFWSIPEIGASVLVSCLDGSTDRRICFGCVPGYYFTHTMPHGRYLHEHGEDGTPDGPMTSNDKPIEPLYRNFTDTFQKPTEFLQNLDISTPTEPRKNMEWRTRGADFQVAGLNSEILMTEDANPSTVLADDFQYEFTEENGDTREIFAQGYSLSLTEATKIHKNAYNEYNYDSQVYSWTTPGFHSVAMDDRPENSRIRMRTTGGHQVILDDSNERVYISTAKGKTWIEMDQNGNIDIYGERNISVHAKEDINFTTDKSFRVKAKEGIHLISDNETRIHNKGTAGGHLHVRSDTDIRTHAKNDIREESDGNMHTQVHGFKKTVVDKKTHIHSKDSMYTLVDKEIHTHALESTYMLVDKISHTHVVEDMYTLVDKQSHIRSKEDMFILTDTQLHVYSEDNSYYTAGGTMHIKTTGGDILNTSEGHHIHLNSEDHEAETSEKAKDAQEAIDALDSYIANEKHSFWSSRVPEHEPWARVMMKIEGSKALVGADKDGSVYAPGNETKTEKVEEDDTKVNGHGVEGSEADSGVEYKYKDKAVGKTERGTTFDRGKYWHR